MDGLGNAMDPTLDGMAGGARRWVHTGFDLVVCEPGRETRQFPLCYSRTTLGGPGGRPSDIVLDVEGLSGRPALLTFEEGRVFFTNVDPRVQARIDGEPVALGEMAHGSELTLGRARILLVKVARQLASLEAYSEPCRGRVWDLGAETATIGRPGRRDNAISLEDPSVSRIHARIDCSEGSFRLAAETTSSRTLVNGEQISEPRTLHDGDLLQFGRQLLRFRLARGDLAAREPVRCRASVLVTDIWDYVTLVAENPLDDTTRQTREFYRAMGRVVRDHGGTVLRFVGDCIVAVFGAAGEQDSAARAVTAGGRMQEELARLNGEWAGRGMPALRIGVGIHTGEVVMGEMGSSDHREYSLMGEGSLVATRLEKETRTHGVGVILSGTTAEELPDGFRLESLGRIPVAGRSEPVEFHGLLEVPRSEEPAEPPTDREEVS